MRSTEKGAGRVIRFCLRGLRLRCPNCGKGRLLLSWTRLRKRCQICGTDFEREHEDFIGAYLINLIIAELFVVTAVVTVMVVTWPAVPWDGMLWWLLPAVIVMPLYTYPFSRGLWLAIDLAYRPEF